MVSFQQVAIRVEKEKEFEELKGAVADTLRLTAYQYNAERPGSDLAEVLSKAKKFESALLNGANGVAAAE